MKCINCKTGQLESRQAVVPAEIKGEAVSVEMEALVCPNCGYTTIHGSHMAEYMRLAADVYRVTHGRLTSSEIRNRRKKWLGMNQAEFASYLPVSPASIKRWELGQVQDEAMDELIRVKTSVEAARENYIRVAALTGVTIEGHIDNLESEIEWQPTPPIRYEIDLPAWQKELVA
jgi:putative zinc finger/helix-turn-helix YgiT family protein